MLRIVLTSTHFSADGGIDQDEQEDECVDSDLPFSGMDDDSLVEEGEGYVSTAG